MRLNPEDFPGMTMEQLNELQNMAEEAGRELRKSSIRCKHCNKLIYLYERRWRHTNGMYTCAMPGRPKPRAAP